MSNGLDSACMVQLSSRSRRTPFASGLEKRELCSICFPDGELDSDDPEDLVVPDGGCAGVLHRRSSGGDTLMPPTGSEGRKTATILRDLDPEELHG